MKSAEPAHAGGIVKELERLLLDEHDSCRLTRKSQGGGALPHRDYHDRLISMNEIYEDLPAPRHPRGADWPQALATPLPEDRGPIQQARHRLPIMAPASSSMRTKIPARRRWSWRT